MVTPNCIFSHSKSRWNVKELNYVKTSILNVLTQAKPGCVVNFPAPYYHILSAKKQDLCLVINMAWTRGRGAKSLLTPDHTIYVNN